MAAAFVSRGRLFLVDDNGSTREIESIFARKHELDAEKRSATTPWQGDGQGSGMWGGFSLWGNRGLPSGSTRYLFTDVVKGRGSTIYYALSGGAVTGLFEYDCGTGEERRLFHENGFRFTGIDFDPEAGQFVIGRARDDGAMDLELLSDDGRSLKMLTGGDSVDCHPAFSKRDTNAVVFQSCGIARDDNGHPMSFGPAAVSRIDKEQQYLNVLGKAIDLGKAGKARRGEEPSLVPRTWELIRVRPGGKPEVVSAGVCAYDLDQEGQILLTNGYRIHRLSGSSHALVGKFDLVEKVKCGGAA